MWIIPFNTIAIDGVHCPAGVPAEVADRTGRDMIAQRFARLAPPPPAPAPAPEPAPAVEAAAASPVVETAAAKRPAKPKRPA